MLNELYVHRANLLRHRLDRVFRRLKEYPSFRKAFQQFVYEEARKEADNVLKDKEIPRNEFSMETLRQFSFKQQLAKYQRDTPILLACVVGSMSKSKAE